MTNHSVGMTNPAEILRPVHLLDDGFQHRGLFRDLDVVVLHRSDFLERLLPAGRLREALTALCRADVVVIREEDAGVEAEVRRLGVEAPVWRMRRSLEVEPELVETMERVIGFCGIARPEEFSDSLIALGVNLEATVNFPDHHRYTRDDMARLAKTAREVRAEAFAVTEKDWVKLDSELMGILERVAPVKVARLAVALRDEELVVGQIRAKLAAG
jgi:tetraacyldisaccharide 4'-kinase